MNIYPVAQREFGKGHRRLSTVRHWRDMMVGCPIPMATAVTVPTLKRKTDEDHLSNEMEMQLTEGHVGVERLPDQFDFKMNGKLRSHPFFLLTTRYVKLSTC